MKRIAGTALAALLALLCAGHAQADPATDIDGSILEAMKQGAVGKDAGGVKADDLYAGAKELSHSNAPETKKRAARMMAQAVAMGHAGAQRELGEMYYFGLGVKEDEAKALKFFKMAADQGDEDAMTSLGWIYCHDGRKSSERKLEELEKEVARRGYDLELFRFTISRPAW